MAPTEVEAPPFDLSQFNPDPNSWPLVEPVDGQILGFIITRLQIGAPLTNHTGTGTMIGPSAQAMAFAGLMGHVPWDVLTSAPNQFYIGSGAIGVGGVLIYFQVNNQPAAIVAAPSVGIGAGIGASGTFRWQ